MMKFSFSMDLISINLSYSTTVRTQAVITINIVTYIVIGARILRITLVETFTWKIQSISQ